jgi:DNA primase
VQTTITDRVRFIEKVFGKGVIARSGEDIAVSCPVCNDTKKKKLSISLKSWSFHCWVCNEKGRTLVPLIRKTKSRETLEVYKRDFLNLKSFHESEDAKEDEVFSYPEGFVPVVNLLDSRLPNVRSVISYLKSRGLKEADFYRYRVGMTPAGKDPRRVFFISLDEEGNENFFVSRSIDDQSKYRYVNSKVDKTSIIFNECDIDWNEPIFLVEGVFDQISLSKNSAVLLGSTLPASSLLFRKLVLNEAHVIISLDPDAKKKSKEIADSLTEYGCKVQIMDIQDSKDLGSMSQQQISEAMKNISDWNPKTSLLTKINSIRSGSIL